MKNIKIVIVLLVVLSLKLSGQTLTMKSPSGGEYRTQEEIEITWESDKIAVVDILLFNGEKSEWRTIATKVNAFDKKYLWKVANDLTSSELYRFKIIASDGNSQYSMSPAFIRIIQIPQMGVSDDLKASKSVSVKASPNPVMGDIHLSWSNKQANKLSILNLNGKELITLSGNFTGYGTISASSLPSGSYFAMVHFLDGALGRVKIELSK